ncbi:G8 domain-containing protein [Nannocystis pusilla]|uniref:G8 domain-containing protein n=1 Tax=Nannocystis pusilla TaxID=889268 RepID=UPI003BF13A13
MRPTILLLIGSALACQASSAGDPIITGNGSATGDTDTTEGTGATGPDDGDTSPTGPGPDDGGTSVGGTDGEPVDCEALTCESWCDEGTWGGPVPTAETDVVVPDGKVVLLDCDAAAKTLTIQSGGAVKASRSTSSTLTVHGNVIVWGRLDLGTEDDRLPADVVAELVFAGMRDDDYVGTPSTVFGGEEFTPPVDTPLEILDTDVGLWVMGRGVFSAAGALKQSWSKLTDGTAPGDPTLSVEDATGWQPGDRVLLTPTAEIAEADFADQFDEATIASVNGTEVTLASATAFEHAGCADCVRRGEAANLTRNVVVRSFDASAHAHVIVGEEGVAQLDSVELRWLGPLRDCTAADEPARRSPLRFHQQADASATSFVRHTAIWASGKDGIAIEHSNGVEVTDVVVYDTQETAVARTYDNSACGLRCTEREKFEPRDDDLTHVLAARVAVPNRAEGCAAIGGAIAMFAGGGDTLDCVVTGTAYNYGTFGNVAAFHWSETGSGMDPADRFEGVVAHNNAGNGISNWQNNTRNDTPYTASAWSNGAYGILHGAYGNSISYQDLVATDNAELGFGIKGINQEDVPRIDGATMDNVGVVDYTFVPESALVLRDVTFTGERSPAFTQIHDACSGGDETDPQDGECIFAWLLIENPVFPAGVVPFDFGWHQNLNTVWEVRGFSHPDYPDLPANFDLYRADNMVAGGSYHADFDAWLVPQ